MTAELKGIQSPTRTVPRESRRINPVPKNYNDCHRLSKRMIDNWKTALRGKAVELVPYRREHVLTYHGWMQDPWIREMTASEPLSLEEEYAMQKSWKEDPKKCTFIVLAKVEGERSQMAGDVNLFFNDLDDRHVCEVEVMIAEERWRRKGLAKEAVRMLMRYAVDHLGARSFYCKIGDDNEASHALFGKIGYVPHAYVEAFKETELRFAVDEERAADLRGLTAHVETVHCPDTPEAAASPGATSRPC